MKAMGREKGYTIKSSFNSFSLSLSESHFFCCYRTPKTGKFVKKRGLFNTQFRRFRNMGLLLVFGEDLMVDVIPWWGLCKEKQYSKRDGKRSEEMVQLVKCFLSCKYEDLIWYSNRQTDKQTMHQQKQNKKWMWQHVFVIPLLRKERHKSLGRLAI